MIIPGVMTVEVLIGNPLVYMLILLSLAVIAGLLRGSMESDEAKTGNKDFAGKENESIWDWLVDAGYGLVGGAIGLGLMEVLPLPELVFIPAFGFAGRIVLINYGKKAEKTSEEQQK